LPFAEVVTTAAPVKGHEPGKFARFNSDSVNRDADGRERDDPVVNPVDIEDVFVLDNDELELDTGVFTEGQRDLTTDTSFTILCELWWVFCTLNRMRKSIG
jgi:hypothetical protein